MKNHDVTMRYSGVSRVATTSGTAASLTAISNHITDVRIVCTANCWYNVGAVATAAAGSVYLPTAVVEYIHVSPGQVISVIQDSAGGTFNMAEMTR